MAVRAVARAAVRSSAAPAAEAVSGTTDAWPLEFHAGRRVRAHLARDGFRASDFPTLLGAAGGPKWLVLYGLDRVLAPVVREAGHEVDLIGSSIGAWRFAAWAQRDPVAALDRLFEGYVDPTPFETPLPDFDALFRRYLETLFPAGAREEATSDPKVFLHAVLTLFPASRVPHLLQLGAAALRNAVSRERFLAVAERVVAGTRPLPEPLARAWPHGQLPLTADNLEDALLATAAVPGMIRPVTGLVPDRRAVDGGIVDYHYDGSQCGGGFVLYPHFVSTLTPGWFDKGFARRRKPAAEVDDLLLICPSPAFVATLPQGRIPDRGDPRRLGNEACARSWRDAGLASRALGDALGEILERDLVPELVAGR